MEKICERFFEETARIENLFFLAGMLGNDEALPLNLQDFFDSEDWDTLEGCFGEIPQHVKDDVENGDRAAFPCWLIESRKLGFVVEMATPVMKPMGMGAVFSWGHYTIKWVYGETLEAALDAGFAWVESQRAKEKSKSTKASAQPAES